MEVLSGASDTDTDLQDAFGSLLNAQEVLGIQKDHEQDLAGGEKSLSRVLEKLHHPTHSFLGSLADASFPSDAYSRPTEAFSLSTAVDVRLKLRILKGLFVPFDVLWVTIQGLSIYQYLRMPFMAADKDP